VICPAAADLVSAARRGLVETGLAATAAERYAAAHLAALRAAAAVLAARTQPAPAVRGRRPTSAWVLLAAVAPELSEWAAFFAAGSRKRAAAEAGLAGAVTAREADDLARDAETFLALVETTLGLEHQPVLSVVSGTSAAWLTSGARMPSGARIPRSSRSR
jgi:hypothetical protein